MLIERMIAFLQQELEISENIIEKENRKNVIDYLETSKGECWGAAVLWAYGKQLSDEENPDNKARDDSEFFNYIQNLLLNWDPLEEKNKFNTQQKREIERFIANILAIQRMDLALLKNNNKSYSELSNIYGYEQQNINLLLEDTKNRKYEEIYNSENFMAIPESFSEKIRGFMRPGKMILFSCKQEDESGHAMAIYINKKDGKIFFYDLNDDSELLANNLDQLSEFIWRNSDPVIFRNKNTRYIDDDIREMKVTIYGLKEENYHPYPSFESLKIKIDELISFYENNKDLFKYISNSKKFKKLLDNCNDVDILTSLKYGTLDEELKLALISRFVENAEKFSQGILKLIDQNYHEQIQKLKKLKRHKEFNVDKFYNVMNKQDIHNLNSKLLSSVRNNNFHDVQNLVVNCADVNGVPSLLIEAIYVRNISIIKFLLEKNIDVNREYDGILPLQAALYADNPELIRMLIEKGADVNRKNKFGQTPFTAAITLKNEKNYEILKYFIDAGANVNEVINVSGGPYQSLLQHAINNKNENAIKLIQEKIKLNEEILNNASTSDKIIISNLEEKLQPSSQADQAKDSIRKKLLINIEIYNDLYLNKSKSRFWVDQEKLELWACQIKILQAAIALIDGHIQPQEFREIELSIPSSRIIQKIRNLLTEVKNINNIPLNWDKFDSDKFKK